MVVSSLRLPVFQRIAASGLFKIRIQSIVCRRQRAGYIYMWEFSLDIKPRSHPALSECSFCDVSDGFLFVWLLFFFFFI